MRVVQVRDFILTRKIGFPFSWRAGSFCKYLLSQKDEIWYNFKIIFTFLSRFRDEEPSLLQDTFYLFIPLIL